MWFVFAPQCISTIAVTRRETNGWKWPAFMVSYLNARGGVLGKKLGFVSTDDANNPQLAVQDAARLIQQEHVVAIAGPTNTRSLA